MEFHYIRLHYKWVTVLLTFTDLSVLAYSALKFYSRESTVDLHGCVEGFC